METSENLIRSAVPGGSVTKPLLLALVALMASGALFRGDDKPTNKASVPDAKPDEGSGGWLGGLGTLIDKFQKSGHGDIINSWLGTGENKPISPGQVGSTLGPNIIKTLAEKSGLSEEELIRQLSQVLPGMVDKLTPHGRLPTVADQSDSTR